MYSQLGQRICPGPAGVDDNQRLAEGFSMPAEAETGPDLQGTARHDQGIGALEGFHTAPDPLHGHIAAEKDDIGFQYPPAVSAGGDVDGIDQPGSDIRVSVRERGPGPRLNVWIIHQELPLYRLSGVTASTRQALHAVQSPVQVRYLSAAGPLVQPVDVLGDQQFDTALAFKSRQGQVGPVRPRIAYRRPA